MNSNTSIWLTFPCFASSLSTNRSSELREWESKSRTGTGDRLARPQLSALNLSPICSLILPRPPAAWFSCTAAAAETDEVDEADDVEMRDAEGKEVDASSKYGLGTLALDVALVPEGWLRAGNGGMGGGAQPVRAWGIISQLKKYIYT